MSDTLAQVIRPRDPSGLTNEELALYVAQGAGRLASYCEELRPYLLALRERFQKKPKDLKIYGCGSWNEYCETVLHRTRRALSYFFQGGNPQSKAGARSVQVVRVGEPDPTERQVRNTFRTEPAKTVAVEVTYEDIEVRAAALVTKPRRVTEIKKIKAPPYRSVDRALADFKKVSKEEIDRFLLALAQRQRGFRNENVSPADYEKFDALATMQTKTMLFQMGAKQVRGSKQ